MAITITNANANISDASNTVNITFSGRLTNSSTGYVIAQVVVNGTTVGSATSTTATSTIAVTFTDSALYTAAQGSSLSGASSLWIYEFDNADDPKGQSTRSGGTITINARNSALSTTSPTTGAPINLDLADPANVTASWTRPHTAFRARVKGYVYNGTSYVQVFNRYGYTTSMNIDVVSLGYKDAMIAAMNSVTPRNFKLELYTQFDDGTSDYIDLGTVNDTDTITSGVTKTFVTLSTISISNFTLSSSTTTVPFTLTKYGTYSHTVKLYANGVLIRTESSVTASGNFTIGTTERNLILNAMPTTTSATTYATVTTEAYGTTSSAAVATTVTLDAAYKPAFDTISWAESSTTTYVETALGYTTGTAFFLTAKSKVTFTVPTTMATGATLTNIRVQFAGTDQSAATSPVTTAYLITAGTLSYTITATDSRGRSTAVTAGSIVVRAYTYPTVDKAEVYRADTGSTDYSPLGTYLRAIYKATASSVLALDGTTQKNWVRIRIDTKLSTDADTSYVNKLSTAGTALTIPETTSAEYSGYLATNTYSVRFRVYDAFYDLNGSTGTLQDTDDYSENIQTLPYGKVSLMLGDDYAAIGKIHSGGTRTLEVGDGGLGVYGSVGVTGAAVFQGIVDMPSGSGIKGSGTGTANTGVFEFNESNGTTRQGWVGKGSGANTDISLANNITNGDVTLVPNGTGKATVAGNEIWHAGNMPFEQASYTPTIYGATTAGTGTYTTQQGRYTKIGKLVFVNIGLLISAHTGTGAMRISLPFTSDTTANFYQTLTIEYQNLTSPANTFVVTTIPANTAYVQLDSCVIATGVLTGLAMDTACAIRLAGHYVADS